MGDSNLDLLQGNLDLLVLKTLAAMGPQHGYGIRRRIEQASNDEVLLNQGTIYAALVRFEQRNWIGAEWGTSENNRKAKFYSITRTGRKQPEKDAAYWQRLSEVMGRVLAWLPKAARSGYAAPFRQPPARVFLQASARRRPRSRDPGAVRSGRRRKPPPRPLAS